MLPNHRTEPTGCSGLRSVSVPKFAEWSAPWAPYHLRSARNISDASGIVEKGRTGLTATDCPVVITGGFQHDMCWRGKSLQLRVST